MFWVSLIDVFGVPSGKTLEYLKGSCTHIHKDIWIMEGETDCLLDEGIEFKVLTEGAVDSLGGLDKEKLRKVCKESLGYTV